MLGETEAKWEEIIKEAQEAINAIEVLHPVKIVLKKHSPGLWVGNQEIMAQSMWIFIYYLLAKHKKSVCRKNSCPQTCADCFLTIRGIIENYEKQKQKYSEIQKYFRDHGRDSFIPDEFNMRSYISKLNRALRSSMVNFEKYLIVSKKIHSETKYGIPLPPKMFKISES